jgi:hypothetical protein
MSKPETQAQPTPNRNPLKSKKYWRNLAITVSAIIIITVVITSQAVNVTEAGSAAPTVYEPGDYTQKVLSGNITLNTVGLFMSGFNVPEEAKLPTLVGNYSVTGNGTKNIASMTIFSQAEFINYLNQKDSIPCYNSEFKSYSSDTLNVTLTKGNYIILIGGVRSGLETFESDISLNFTV